MVMRLSNRAFTLIELLVVISIIALLVGLLLPALAGGRRAAIIVKAHADLRSITQAIELYRNDNDDEIPPTRFSCSTRAAYELPIELKRYLPHQAVNLVDTIHMPDAFDEQRGYLYRAVGTAIVNEYTVRPNSASLWVPDGFPYEERDTGQYYCDPETSPVRYAVWSMGPDPEAALFVIPGRLPIPKRYWLRGPADAGVVVHLEDKYRQMHLSP
jgi:prepilin-type N-terminal cleavage/methylation domain-containing protein